MLTGRSPDCTGPASMVRSPSPACLRARPGVPTAHPVAGTHWTADEQKEVDELLRPRGVVAVARLGGDLRQDGPLRPPAAEVRADPRVARHPVVPRLLQRPVRHSVAVLLAREVRAPAHARRGASAGPGRPQRELPLRLRCGTGPAGRAGPARSPDRVPAGRRPPPVA